MVRRSFSPVLSRFICAFQQRPGYWRFALIVSATPCCFSSGAAGIRAAVGGGTFSSAEQKQNTRLKRQSFCLRSRLSYPLLHFRATAAAPAKRSQ